MGSLHGHFRAQVHAHDCDLRRGELRYDGAAAVTREFADLPEHEEDGEPSRDSESGPEHARLRPESGPEAAPPPRRVRSTGGDEAAVERGGKTAVGRFHPELAELIAEVAIFAAARRHHGPLLVKLDEGTTAFVPGSAGVPDPSVDAAAFGPSRLATPAKLAPLSSASPSNLRSCVRPRERRDLTVPTGTFSIAATSSYVLPSMSKRTSAVRNSAGTWRSARQSRSRSCSRSSRSSAGAPPGRSRVWAGPSDSSIDRSLPARLLVASRNTLRTTAYNQVEKADW